MSVPSWERDLSHTQFIYEAYQMCIDIGHIVMRAPNKYRPNYGDALIKDSLECLKYCRLANAIFMTKDTPEEERMRRRQYLLNARAIALHVSTVADVFFGLTRNVDGAKQEKLEKQQRRIGSYASSLNKLISGVLKHDKEMVTS